MLDTLNGDSSGKPALGQQEQVHKTQVSEPGATLFVSEPGYKGVINGPTLDKVPHKHEKDTLRTKVKDLI